MAGADLHPALGNGGSQWGASLGTWVLSLLPLRRRRNRCRGPCQERRFPVRTPGNRGSHVGTNEPRFDRQFELPVDRGTSVAFAWREFAPAAEPVRDTNEPPPARSLPGFPDGLRGRRNARPEPRRPACPSPSRSIRPECLDPPLRHLPQTRKRAPVFSRPWRVARALLLESPGGRHPAAIGRPVVSPPPAGTVPGG